MRGEVLARLFLARRASGCPGRSRTTRPGGDSATRKRGGPRISRRLRTADVRDIVESGLYADASSWSREGTRWRRGVAHRRAVAFTDGTVVRPPGVVVSAPLREAAGPDPRRCVADLCAFEVEAMARWLGVRVQGVDGVLALYAPSRLEVARRNRAGAEPVDGWYRVERRTRAMRTGPAPYAELVYHAAAGAPPAKRWYHAEVVDARCLSANSAREWRGTRRRVELLIGFRRIDPGIEEEKAFVRFEATP